jgi:hypothetical protein
VHGLIACSADALGNAELAQQHYADATLLSSVDELVRRYPEIERLKGKYAASIKPGEVV